MTFFFKLAANRVHVSVRGSIASYFCFFFKYVFGSLEFDKAATLEDLIADWNKTIPNRRALAEEWNQQVHDDFSSGKLTAEATIAALEPLPRPLTNPSESWVRWWKSQWGWSNLTRSNDDTTWLPYWHQDMIEARNKVRELFEQGGVDPRLCLNFDQVWRNSWSVSRHKLCYKHRSKAGIKAKKTRHDPRFDKKVHSVKGARASITATWSLTWNLFQCNATWYGSRQLRQCSFH